MNENNHGGGSPPKPSGLVNDLSAEQIKALLNRPKEEVEAWEKFAQSLRPKEVDPYILD